MMKKITAALACIIAVTASTAVYAAETPQTVIDETSVGTSISITDITPREEDADEAKVQYTTRSFYPVEVQTAEEDGIKLLVKTFIVPENTNPQVLIEEGLTRRGTQYEVSDILRRELEGKQEQKTISQTVTLESDTNKRKEILSLLEPNIEYQENGFSGILSLNLDSIQTEVTDTSRYSYTLKDTREYMGLERSDPYYVPKTAEKNGVTLKLSHVNWVPMASAADNSSVPSLFKATAEYSGTAWGSKEDGYLVTASYTGQVSRTTPGEVAYSIVYEEVKASAIIPESPEFDWKPIFITILVIGLIGGALVGGFFLVRLLKRKKRNGENNPYANRPKMKRPDLLDEMDRGLGDAE
jgi:hypothetical protein